jgi:hypothetical protein
MSVSSIMLDGLIDPKYLPTGDGGDFVPYTGANQAVNLGTQNLTVGGILSANSCVCDSFVQPSIVNQIDFTAPSGQCDLRVNGQRVVYSLNYLVTVPAGTPAGTALPTIPTGLPANSFLNNIAVMEIKSPGNFGINSNTLYVEVDLNQQEILPFTTANTQVGGDGYRVCLTFEVVNS